MHLKHVSKQAMWRSRYVNAPIHSVSARAVLDAGVWSSSLIVGRLLQPWPNSPSGAAIVTVLIVYGATFALAAFALRLHRNFIYGSFDESLPALLDWDMLIRVTASHELTAIPVLASLYTTSAPHRISDRPDKPDAIQTVRDRASAERVN